MDGRPGLDVLDRHGLVGRLRAEAHGRLIAAPRPELSIHVAAAVHLSHALLGPLIPSLSEGEEHETEDADKPYAQSDT